MYIDTPSADAMLRCFYDFEHQLWLRRKTPTSQLSLVSVVAHSHLDLGRSVTSGREYRSPTGPMRSLSVLI